MGASNPVTRHSIEAVGGNVTQFIERRVALFLEYHEETSLWVGYDRWNEIGRYMVSKLREIALAEGNENLNLTAESLFEHLLRLAKEQIQFSDADLEKLAVRDARKLYRGERPTEEEAKEMEHPTLVDKGRRIPPTPVAQDGQVIDPGMHLPPWHSGKTRS